MTLLPMVHFDAMNTTEKISITLGRVELQQAKSLASHLGLSLSTVITDAVREHVEAKARKAAGLAVLATFAPADLPSEKKMQQLLQIWNQPGKTPEEPARAAQTAKRRVSQPKRRAR
jgi:hypothetical protein